MIKKHALICLVALIGLGSPNRVNAQGNFTVFVNNKVVRPIEGVYEVNVKDHIKIKIDESGNIKFPIVKSAIAKEAEIPPGQNQQQQQQQQQLQTAEDAESALNLPVIYQNGQTIVELAIPDTSSHQVDFNIILTFLPNRLQAVKHYRGYTGLFKFFIK